ncbi:MAG: CBS domain-containing protein [Candidatus Woesearchaeota archaeon]
MIHNIEDIKKMRKKLGLSQKELADKSGVSQSAIAKIEAGSLNPSFSIAQQLIFALEISAKKHTVLAKEVMQKNVISCKPTERTENIIAIMHDKNISQIPVLSKNVVVGLVTEDSIIKHRSLSNAKAYEVMEEAPPFVGLGTPITILLDLLKHFSCILVSDKGELSGIITKSDLLKNSHYL